MASGETSPTPVTTTLRASATIWDPSDAAYFLALSACLSM
jgi:hypothetical protein